MENYEFFFRLEVWSSFLGKILLQKNAYRRHLETFVFFRALKELTELSIAEKMISLMKG